MVSRPFHAGRALTAAVLVIAIETCSGSAPSQLPSPSPTPTVVPATPPPPPSPSPTPTASPGACALGKGDTDAVCFRQGETLFQDVDAAIDRLVQQRPDIFNLNDAIGPGGYRVVKTDEYFNGVIRNLEQAGFCANRLGDDLQVKKSNEYSEEFDIILSSGFIRRGQGSYNKTCRPAIFPLDPEDWIVRVPIFLFGYEGCPDPGREMPDFGLRNIPLGCTGLVTATPKDKNNVDVDPRIHGPEITWLVTDGLDRVEVESFPDVPFNKKLKAVRLGPFTVCATVKGRQGCYNFTVIP